MFSKKNSCDKKVTKGFTLVEIIVVLVILAILAAATIPSMLGFIDDAKFKTIDNEARVVRNAAQAYATEQSAKGETDEDIQNRINGVINSNHDLHYLLQNDASGTVFETKVEKGNIRKFKYTKEIVDTNEDLISDKIRYAVFDDEKSSLLHATGSVATIDINDFKADVIAALKTDFVTELGSDVRDFIYPVGSYYVSHNSTSPATLFGGEWTQIEDRFLYCAASSAQSGQTGGNSTHTHTVSGNTNSHTLTIDQIPSHNHTLRSSDGVLIGSLTLGLGSNCAALVYPMSADGTQISSTGGGEGHSHGISITSQSSSSMPPYLTVCLLLEKNGISENDFNKIHLVFPDGFCNIYRKIFN